MNRITKKPTTTLPSTSIPPLTVVRSNFDVELPNFGQFEQLENFGDGDDLDDNFDMFIYGGNGCHSAPPVLCSGNMECTVNETREQSDRDTSEAELIEVHDNDHNVTSECLQEEPVVTCQGNHLFAKILTESPDDHDTAPAGHLTRHGSTVILTQMPSYIYVLKSVGKWTVSPVISGSSGTLILANEVCNSRFVVITTE